MTKHRGPADASNDGKVIKPANVSQSFARGGGVMRHVEEQHRENGPHDVSGGAKTERRIQPVEREAGETDNMHSHLRKEHRY